MVLRNLVYIVLVLAACCRGGAEPAVGVTAETLGQSKHFTKWTNDNGIVSYVLSTRVAPFQQSMYYTNISFTNDGKYLWFSAAFPPANNKCLGVVDFVNDEVRVYKETVFEGASPLIDLDNGQAYWVEARGRQRNIGDYYRIFKRGAQADDAIEEVGRIPHLVEGSAPPRQVATHLTFNADKTAIGFDSGNYANNKTFAGVVSLDTGTAKVWGEFDRRYNHGLMHPTDKDVMLIMQDYFTDNLGEFGEKGARVGIENRMWLIFSDGEKKAVFPSPNSIYHEWWSTDGRYLWYIDKDGNYGGVGTCRVAVDTKRRLIGKPRLIWPNAVGHSHCDGSGRYLVGDHNYKSWKDTNTVRVSFYNAAKAVEVDIVTSMQYPQYDQYHTHPHPQFAKNDEFICYTATFMGYDTLALCPVKQLIEHKKGDKKI